MAPRHQDSGPMTPQVKLALTAIGGVAGAAIIAWPIYSYLLVKKCEQPAYETCLVLGAKQRSWYDRAPAITIRKYKPYLVAEVEVTGSLDSATTKGFKQIANFIFGNNSEEGASEISPEAENYESMKGGEGEKIAMTVPVGVQMAGKDKHTVTSVMPSKYTEETLPKPRNPAIKIRKVPGHFLAALSWRGGNYPSQKAVDAKLAELRGVLGEHSIQPSSASHPRLYGYYPPFAVPAMKLYDVLLEVDYEAVDDKLPVVDVSKAPGELTFAEKLKQGA